MSSKPVIVYLIDGLQAGGAEKSLLEITKRLSRFVPIVCVLSDSLELRQSFENEGVKVIPLHLERSYRFPKHAKLIRDTLLGLNPAVIHSCLFHADMTLRYLDVRTPRVTGLVSNMYSSRRLRQLPLTTRIKVKMLRHWDRHTSGRINHFISNSFVIKEAYKRILGIEDQKITVIPRGRAIQKPAEYLERPGQYLLSVGRLIASKGYYELIQAFGQLAMEKPGLRLVILGDGPDRKRLERLTERLGLATRVDFRGTVANVNDFLHEGRLFVFPSHYEGLPGALIEAMLARIPIVCSDIPENKECVDESMCLFHRVGDWRDLARQIERALTLEDWDLRTHRAFDYAAEHFEIGQVVRQYEEVYLRLLDS
ncbi:glycosyltransferase [Algoriphagus sp. H41]|uniref:Glycosyltransferase n=1 Tax=Algoriphagus oliviformis TaxID=2811231 RepID=A0ABS3C7G7_9BACT|nr:glycosyltransferase [Algoriphagus oliviformis]MBN7812958.1 glycosyltransferase [Algoriphagus oliviformis]